MAAVLLISAGLTIIAIDNSASQTRANEMSGDLFEQITRAYGPPMDQDRAAQVYTAIIKDYSRSLGGLSDTIKNELITDFINEKVATITAASASKKAEIWKQDHLLSEISKNDDLALDQAIKVKLGGRLTEQERAVAEAKLRRLEEIAGALDRLDESARSSLGDRLSEAILDYRYAISPKGAPQSFRLSRR